MIKIIDLLRYVGTTLNIIGYGLIIYKYIIIGICFRIISYLISAPSIINHKLWNILVLVGIFFAIDNDYTVMWSSI